MTLRAPFPWFGGKSRVAHLVWDRFGEVRNYVEPFFGSGAVLLGRPGSPGIETVNDADAYLANFWRAAAADPDEVARFADWPVNEADLHARHRWLVETARGRVDRVKTEPDFFDAKVAGWWVWGQCLWIGSGWCSPGIQPIEKRPALSGNGGGNGVHKPSLGAGAWPKRPVLQQGKGGRGVHRLSHETLTDIQRAARFYYLQKLSFGGKRVSQTFGTSTTRSPRINLMRIEEDLSEIHQRLASVVIEQLGWLECLDRYDRPETLFLIDPPYWETEGYATPRMDLPEYEKLARRIGSLAGKAILTINAHKEMGRIFGHLPHTPVSVRYTVGGGRGSLAEEWVCRSWSA